MNFINFILRKISEFLSFYYINKDLRSLSEETLIYKFLNEEIKKKNFNSQGLKKTHKIFNQQLLNLIKTRKLKNFLRESFIQKIFFVHNRWFINNELQELKKDPRWNFYKKIIAEDDLGNPVRYFLYPKSSGNRINHVFHLYFLLFSINKKITNIKNVLEFGGGYGCMARIFFKINKKISYTIFDTKVVNLLQYYYLKMLGMDAGFNQKNQFYLINKLPIKIKKKYLFIANWSLSETSINFRKKFEKIIKHSQLFLIAFQEKFENINNLIYFKRIAKELNKEFHIRLIKHPYYKGSFIKKENHYFIIGQKL